MTRDAVAVVPVALAVVLAACSPAADAADSADGADTADAGDAADAAEAAGVVTDDPAGGASGAAGATTPDDGRDTIAVQRRDLAEALRFGGRVGYGQSVPLPVPAAGGTVTWLPPVGSVLDAGDEAARIDDRPVLVVTGDVPAYRALCTGVTDGADVLQLERTLVAAGHGSPELGSPDRAFTAATAEAVRAWQRAAGIDADGRLELGEYVATPTPARVAAQLVPLGAAAGEPLVAVTGTATQVSVVVDTHRAGPLDEGRAVTVELPDGARTGGTVSSVVDLPTGGDEQDGGDQPQRVVTVTTDATLPTGAGAATVVVDEVRARDVVAVPVAALLATADGFVVEVVRDGTITPAPVEVGVVVAGWAAITGDVGVGDRVVVP